MTISRRQLLQTACVGPFVARAQTRLDKLLKRDLGRLNFEATTLGLGGQASLQWTPEGVDPVLIILKAFHLGINYFDTSNAYGPSQLNYGKAFRELHLIPGEPGYNQKLRESIFLTSKTGQRWAKGGVPNPKIRNFGNGPAGSHAADDVRRTLSQIFGDGEGNYPKGAYLNLVLCHALSTLEEVEALYTGLDKTDAKAEHIGTLAVLRDLRDGTNLTGLNPKEEKLIRHVGFSGHNSPPVMIEMLQRDTGNLLDGMLVAINANDRLHFNMQYNNIPVAAARKMGLIGMKTFADGSMYGKQPMFSNNPSHVIRTIGNASLPSHPLIQYSLTTPGIGTLIVGTGHIDDDPKKCQLGQNLIAAQIKPTGLSMSDRRAIEKTTATVQDGKTNYFQLPHQDLTPPRDVALSRDAAGGMSIVKLTWQTAYAGDEPISHYEVLRDGQKIGSVNYRPQVDKTAFLFEDKTAAGGSHKYVVATVDAIGRRAEAGELTASA
ncbi:MAG TPA: aldo/keto reductase [Terriglobales bacterium]|jgi:aryl-alcohol dehydrogenase-like predicted oxidoreductase|nr:aldo/keto reductase [Candidatus Limnocylindrales bacterium]